MSQMVIVLFFTSTSFPAKTSTRVSGAGSAGVLDGAGAGSRAALSNFHLRHQGSLWEHLKAPSSLAYFCIDSFQTWNSVFRMNVGFSWVLSKLPLRVSCCWSSAVSSALREARVRCLQAADAPVPSKSDPLGLIPLLKITYRCVRLNS